MSFANFVQLGKVWQKIKKIKLIIIMAALFGDSSLVVKFLKEF